MKITFDNIDKEFVDDLRLALCNFHGRLGKCIGTTATCVKTRLAVNMLNVQAACNLSIQIETL